MALLSLYRGDNQGFAALLVLPQGRGPGTWGSWGGGLRVRERKLWDTAPRDLGGVPGGLPALEAFTLLYTPRARGFTEAPHPVSCRREHRDRRRGGQGGPAG